jgi:PAS domain S-box-containing protein
MLVASGVLALVVTIVFVALLLSIRTLRSSSDRARHSEQVIAAANRLEKDVLDIETGPRGFVITGDSRFLEPWRAGLVAFPREAQALERLVGDDPQQEARARAIESAGRSYIAVWSRPLVTLARQDLSKARARVAGGDGKRRVDAMRAQFANFGRAEEALLGVRRARASSASDRAIALGIAGIAGAVLLILLFAGYLSRAIVAPVRRVSEAAAHFAAGDLSTRLPESGVGEIGDLARAFNAMTSSLVENRDELESQNVELELQASELETQRETIDFERRRLEAVLDQMVGGVIIAEAPSGRIVLSTRQVEEILGRPLEAESSDDYATASVVSLDGMPHEHSRSPLGRALKHGETTTSGAMEFRRPDGSIVSLDVHAAPVRDEHDRIVAAVATFYDVSERRRTEEAVRELNAELERQNAELGRSSEELEARQTELEVINVELEAQQAELERAMDELAAEKGRVEGFYRFTDHLIAAVDLDPFARLALDEICEFADAEIGTLYVLEVGDRGAFALAAARGADERSLPGEIAPGAGLAGRALSERRTLAASHGQTGLRLAVFGEDVAVHHELHVPLINAGQVLGLLTLARAADRPFAAEELDAINHLADQAAIVLSSRLAHEQAMHLLSVNRAVIDATLDGIRLVDLEGRTMLANAEIERFTTEVFGLAPGLTLAERSALITGKVVDPAEYLAAEAKIASDPEAETLDEFRLVESGRWFRRYTAPVRNAAGELIGRIIVVRETTREREADRLKSELVATVSHELRTPLAGVMGFAELLARHDVDESSRADYAETIYQQSLRLTALVNDFLDLERIEAGAFALTLAPFDLHELLLRQTELHAGQSPAHTIEVRAPEAQLVVRGERDQIARVIDNLLSNAVKYSPVGGAVVVTAAAEGGLVRVSVEDAGLGIPADQQAQIFTKFFRVDSSDTRRIGGTGLGLALSSEIVEAHGGRIGFDSVHGRGSTFWFELPLAASAIDA